jgi:1,2-diacylglycerol 3-beta-glucosyltransferase
MQIVPACASYLLFAVVAYYAVMFVMSLRRHDVPRDIWCCPLFVVVVPARDEELVIEGTLASLAALEYDGEYRVLVVDDGSTDATASMVRSWADSDNHVRLLSRSADEAGRGKSEVLNHAFSSICGWVNQSDPWLAGRTFEQVVLVIVDADGRLEQRCLQTVAPYFADASVGSVQIGVRIANAGTSLLARMQDIEFVGFSWFVQIARDRLGSSGLGGNGQFSRLTALAGLGRRPWAPGALTEDLDLGLRLIADGWRIRFCPLTYVDQQGLTQWRPLLRQRTRWIQGHYQCWRYIRRVLRARRARLVTRVDLVLYLLLVVTVLIYSLMLVCEVLASFGLMAVDVGFVAVIPDGDWRRLASLVIAIFPLVAFMSTYQRYSRFPFRWYEIPAFAVVFTLYAYVWLFTTLRALTRIALRRGGWVKTPRVVMAPAQ